MDPADYVAARMVSDPLCLFDCDVPVTGCVAAVLIRADRARDLRHAPAYVAAVVQQTTRYSATIHYTQQDHIEAGRPVIDELWRQAGAGADDVDVAEVYDGFAPSALYWLEAAGFCPRGQALPFIQGGRIARDGELPVNTFGGSLSEGRLHGMGHIAEAVLQIGRRAGERQTAHPDLVLVLDGSPMMRGGGLILSAVPS